MLIPCREIKSLCCEIHIKHINTLCGQVLSFLLLDLVINIVINSAFKCLRNSKNGGLYFELLSQTFIEIRSIDCVSTFQ